MNIRSPRNPYLHVVLPLMVASILLGAWEIAVTRLASVLYFFNLTYLTLALCLAALGAGALWARATPRRPKINHLLLAMSILLVPCWMLISRFDAAWICGVFAWPFILFGVASTLAWHSLPERRVRSHLYVAELLGAVIGLAIIGPSLSPLLPVDPLGGAGIHTHLRELVEAEGLVEHDVKSSSYARTDLIRTGRDSVVYIFTDAMFLTRSIRWDGHSPQFDDPHVESLARLKRLPHLALRGDKVLLLGAGAGFDAAIALQQNAEQIDAIEINPDTIAFARSLDDWAGGVMRHPKVRTHQAEARRFVAQSSDRWDLINLTLLQTSPAVGRGRSHIDGRVLTVEAISSYLAHLRPLGAIAVIQNTRLLADRTYHNLLAANQGHADRITRFVIAPQAGDYNPFSHLLLMRNEAFSPQERLRLRSIASPLGISLIPADGSDHQAPISSAPATDDRPFLFEEGYASRAQIMLAGSLALLSLFFVLVRRRRSPGEVRVGLAAALVGAVSLALQILIVYRAQSAIGHPGIAMGTGLAAVLGGAGVGVLLFGDRMSTHSAWQTSGLLALAGLTIFAVTGVRVTDFCAELTVAQAALLMALYIGMCSLGSGLPFLATMQACRALPGRGEGLVIGCDGLGGVLGAALATWIAMSLGFNSLAGLLILGMAGFLILKPSLRDSDG